jgi:aminopeptidase N
VTPIPVFVAGFNFGNYLKMDLPPEKDGFRIEAYYLPDLPDNFVRLAPSGMAPHSMTQFAVDQTRLQIEICNYFFGSDGFDHIYITEQPDFDFGQSWPNLIYLPLPAYMDSTQRWMLFGMNNSMAHFVQEVTPHEVSHQWWGHAVGWSSYHDQWLSEGFAEFSAGLFLEQVTRKDWKKDYIQFWDHQRNLILQKNNFGVSPNDAGPLWLGLRLTSPRTEEAYQNSIYPKGAYVLAMLRSMMYSNTDQDKEFIAMMHDFVQSHRDHPASTESFKAIAEKHMTKLMDFQRNGKLDWFFNEWVYGTATPRYKFEYQLSPGPEGKTKLHMSLTQSDVDENFAMLVPVFADMGKGMNMIGQVPIVGNSVQTRDVLLPAQPKKVAYNAYKEILER